MPTTITGTSLTVGSIDLTTPLATADGGTGSSTISPYQMVLGTAQATTSGTSIDFTGIPSWVKRITVMFDSVSSNGTSIVQIQLGSGSVDTSGYNSESSYIGASTVSTSNVTTGFHNNLVGATSTRYGSFIMTKVSGNLWASTHNLGDSTLGCAIGAGSKTISGTLDRIRLTTVNGTDTFDTGSVNIMYEGY